MKLQHITAYISVPAKVIMTLITVLIAVMILQAVIMGMVSIFLPQNGYQRDEPELTQAQEQRWRIAEMGKLFLVDGTIHLIHSIKDQPNRWDQERQIEVYDANNNLLWAGEQEKNPYTYLQWPDYRRGIHQLLEPRYMAEMRMITPQLSQTLMVPVVNSERQILQRWRYEPGPDYFVGFNSEGGKIGYAGSNGFTKLQNEVKPFGEFKYMTGYQAEESPSPQLLWHAENHLYQINFEKATVEAIVDLQDDIIERIALTNWAGIEPQKNKYRPQMHVLTDKARNFLLLKAPDQQLNINTPAEWLYHSLLWGRDIRIVALDDKILMQHYGTDQKIPPRDTLLPGKWWEEYRTKSHKEWTELHQVDSAGKLTLIRRFEWIRPPLVEKIASSRGYDLSLRVRYYETMFSPPVLNIAWLWWYQFDSEIVFYRDWVEPYRSMVELIRYHQSSNMALNWAIGGLLVCAAFYHAWPRRTSWGRFVFWLVFVAVFNLAGFLTYLALNHTTVIRCSTCGKKRGLQRPDCPSCGALLPIPKGRETDLIMVGQSNS